MVLRLKPRESRSPPGLRRTDFEPRQHIESESPRASSTGAFCRLNGYSRAAPIAIGFLYPDARFGREHEAENDMANREQRKNKEKKKPKKDKDKPKSGNPNTPFSSGSGQDGQKNKK